MDREQHITQDAAEHYATFLMAKVAEESGKSFGSSSDELWGSFLTYLHDRGWNIDDFTKKFPKYKSNCDQQIPAFVNRLIAKFSKSKFEFGIDEARYRNYGIKADFSIRRDDSDKTWLVSLKNYIGSGGIDRPQVSSGTFLSFACGFVFDRVGVGVYNDPRPLGTTFKGSQRSIRNRILNFQGRGDQIEDLEKLEHLQAYLRERLLGIRYYDESEVKATVEAIVGPAQGAILRIFDRLGPSVVREKFLERAGLDGNEEILFFDKNKSIDSITNDRFSSLVTALNSPDTTFSYSKVGQNIRFKFSRSDEVVLATDVPLTINTNGAWHRPKTVYTGTQMKIDKGKEVWLRWGEIRPAKSKEIATSTNTYINLKATGVFD